MDKVRELLELKNRLRDQAKSYTSDFITVGDYTYGCPKVMAWDEGAHLHIGKFCSVAENVTIMLGGEHRSDWNTTYPFNTLLESFSNIKGHPSTKGDIIIGNDVWIASGAKIMSGVTIADGAIVAANALVTKDIPPYAVSGGVPARVIKYRFSADIIEKLEKVKWWNLNEKILAEIIPFLQSDDVVGLLGKIEECKTDPNYYSMDEYADIADLEEYFINLYYDTGAGLNENDSIKWRKRFPCLFDEEIEFPVVTNHVRFDPIELKHCRVSKIQVKYMAENQECEAIQSGFNGIDEGNSCFVFADTTDPQLEYYFDKPIKYLKINAEISII